MRYCQNEPKQTLFFAITPGIITIELLPESVEAGLDEKVVLNNLKEALDFVKNNFK